MSGDAEVQNVVPVPSKIIPTSEINAEDATPVGGATSSVFRGTWNGTKVAIKLFPHETAPEVGEPFNCPLPGLSGDLPGFAYTPHLLDKCQARQRPPYLWSVSRECRSLIHPYRTSREREYLSIHCSKPQCRFGHT